MGRQEINRSVQQPPRFFSFSAVDAPTGGDQPATANGAIQLRLDEYEAIRLADHLGYDHGEASRIMAVSRPTFTRLLNKARAKLADFLTSGAPLEIRGARCASRRRCSAAADAEDRSPGPFRKNPDASAAAAER
jgi:predicted DNA-binding protein (UPF0251 family)